MAVNRAITLLPISLLIAGCLPGGAFTLVPVSHYDRPTVRGILLADEQPIEGWTVQATSYIDRAPDTCGRSSASAQTNAQGEFEIEGDKDLVTLWLGVGPNGLLLCLPDTTGKWRTSLSRSDFPPYLQAHINVVCRLEADNVLSCLPLVDDAYEDIQRQYRGDDDE